MDMIMKMNNKDIKDDWRILDCCEFQKNFMEWKVDIKNINNQEIFRMKRDNECIMCVNK